MHATYFSQRSNSHINVDDVKIFTTPRKLIRSLQDLGDYDDTGCSEKQSRRFRSPMRGTSGWTSTSMHGLTEDINCGNNNDKFSSDGHGRSESVSSTEGVFSNNNLQLSAEIVPANKYRLKNHRSSTRRLVCGLLVSLFAVFLFLLAIGDQDNHHIIVPT